MLRYQIGADGGNREDLNSERNDRIFWFSIGKKVRFSYAGVDLSKVDTWSKRSTHQLRFNTIEGKRITH